MKFIWPKIGSKQEFFFMLVAWTLFQIVGLTIFYQIYNLASHFIEISLETIKILIKK